MSESQPFEAFMLAHQDMVFTVAVRLTGNAAEAEDISQEVFLKAYERFAELANSPTCSGWLRTVARNLSLNHLTRYRARWRFFSEMEREDSNDDYLANLPAADSAPHPSEMDRWKDLELALQKLPASQRVPLVLYHFEEMNYEAIAERLKISLSKVKTDIHRGRQALYRRFRMNPNADQGWEGGLRRAPLSRADSGANAGVMNSSTVSIPA